MITTIAAIVAITRATLLSAIIQRGVSEALENGYSAQEVQEAVDAEVATFLDSQP